MNASDWNRRLTVPGRTYCLTIVGSWVSADSLQKGHWRSANSVTFTGAFAPPSVAPCCGMPAKRAVVALAPATEPDDEAAVEPVAVEPECDAETAISTATTAAAAPSTAPRRSRRLRRAAAARCAVSRSTRARRASSRSCLRVGWEIVGMVEVLLRAGNRHAAGARAPRQLVKWLADRPRSAGERALRRAATAQGDGDEQAAARDRAARRPARRRTPLAAAAARGRQAPDDADEVLGADVAAGCERQQQKQRGAGHGRAPADAREQQREGDRQGGGRCQAQQRSGADAHRHQR